jgi:hypothetical protein
MCEGHGLEQSDCESVQCCTWQGESCRGDDTRCSEPVFVVSEGPCTISDGLCLESPSYGSGQTCTIDITYGGWLYVETFDTEADRDVLTVGGTQFSGTGDALDGIAVSAALGAIQWVSDNSSISQGFRICLDLAPCTACSDLDSDSDSDTDFNIMLPCITECHALTSVLPILELDYPRSATPEQLAQTCEALDSQGAQDCFHRCPQSLQEELPLLVAYLCRCAWPRLTRKPINWLLDVLLNGCWVGAATCPSGSVPATTCREPRPS